MTNPIRMIFNPRLLAVVRKEFTQIRRDSRMVITMTIQPAVQLLLLGFALSATVTNLKLGVVDDDQSIESRALANALGESKSFRLTAAASPRKPRNSIDHMSSVRRRRHL
jgi:ABC-2 type transport system permease protein